MIAILAVSYGALLVLTTIFLVSIGPGSPLKSLRGRPTTVYVYYFLGSVGLLFSIVTGSYVRAYGTSQKAMRSFVMLSLPWVAVFIALVPMAFAVNSQFMTSLANEVGTTMFHFLSNVIDGTVWKS